MEAGAADLTSRSLAEHLGALQTAGVQDRFKWYCGDDEEDEEEEEEKKPEEEDEDEDDEEEDEEWKVCYPIGAYRRQR